jgi:hypothetical protein
LFGAPDILRLYFGAPFFCQIFGFGSMTHGSALVVSARRLFIA